VTGTMTFPTNPRSTHIRLMSGSSLSPVERQMGRLMRSPDDHVDPAPADPAVADPAPVDPAVDPAAAPAAAVDPVDDGSGPTALGSEEEPDASADPAAPEGPPEAYDLATEGVDLDPDAVADAEPVLRELGLSNDNAKKLVPVAQKFADRVAERTLATVIGEGNAQRKAWLDEAKAADDIGGGKWEQTLHVAARGLDSLGFVKGHPFRQSLEATGYGNHPDMIRMAAKLGELVGEDGDFVRADASAPTQKEELSKRLYPED